MKILFASSEVAPFVKTGGLGDVLGALPIELNKQGIDARVIMPKYGRIADEYKKQMEYITHIFIKMGWRSQYCGVFRLLYRGVTIYFVDNEFYFGGLDVYGKIKDDLERFIFFSKSVLALLPQIDFFPDIIHVNDWQTAIIPVLLKEQYKEYEYQKIKTVLTIHNLHFQGRYDIESISDLTDLEKRCFNKEGLEYFGDANVLKGGIVYADFLTTVSPTYADEIKMPYYGEGLDGLLNAKNGALKGIVNGIDYEEYSSNKDIFIEINFNKRNFASHKKQNKIRLQKDLGLNVNEDIFMLSMVTRLTNQKGLDLIEAVMDRICELPIQFVILGTGDAHYESMLRHYQYKYPDKVSAQIKFDVALSHKIYASADAFLMPSLFEPCGLSQLIAMRYGTLPIVRETGGLKDTVLAYNEFEHTGTGFSFKNYNAHEMLFVLEYALKTYNKKAEWHKIAQHAMNKDFSWQSSAKEYIKIYEGII